MQDKDKSSCQWLWVFGQRGIGGFLGGVGTLLLGIGALITSFKTKDMLGPILQIQERIEKSVDQLKTLTAKSKVNPYTALGKLNSSKEEIKKAIIRSIPQNPIDSEQAIYLPADRFNSTVEKIYEAKSLGERTEILKQSLEYSEEDTWVRTFQPASMGLQENAPRENSRGNRK